MSQEDQALEAVERSLGYRFVRRELLRDALTHRSYANERPSLAPRDNERLEFLGDALVGLAVASLLWQRFPAASEGELTRRRADLVCESSLADIANALGLGDALRLGRGEERSGGRTKPRLLASALEACLGAVHVDGGPGEAYAVARRLFETRAAATGPGERDYKSRVQELVQGNTGITPRYVLLGVEGPDHDKRFEVAIEVDGRVVATGSGRSKAEAEQRAAQQALERLPLEPSDSPDAEPPT